MPSHTRSWLKDICILTLFIGLLYSMFLGSRPLTPPDEGRYSEIPREMVVSGDYLTPHLNGVKYFEKPALFYWLQSFSIKAFGLNEWALRLVTDIMGILGCLLTYWGTRQLYGRRTALLATLVLGSSILYSGLAHFITLDMTVSVFLTGCFLSFLVANQFPPGNKRRNYMWLMYTFAGLATLTKGLIGVIFPGMVIFTWLCVTGQWRQLSSYCLLSGSCLFLAITLPWHLLVQLKNPEFFNFYFYEQHFLRYLTDYADRKQPLWFFPLILTFGFFPWTGFLLVAIKNQLGGVWKTPKQYSSEIFLLLWSSLIFLFYWLSHSQLIPYILPIFPPLAIITGRYLNENWEKRSKSLNIGFLTAGLFSLLISIVVLTLYHYHKAFVFSLVDVVSLLPLFFGMSAFVYWRKNIKWGIISLLISTFLFSIFANFCYQIFETRSIKPLATQLKMISKPDDVIYNFNQYYQDLPVYLEHTVKLVNWTGELTFGSKHQSINDIFLNEKQLYREWPSQPRKFMFLKKEDLASLRKNSLKFYVVSVEGRYALISNQETQQ